MARPRSRDNRASPRIAVSAGVWVSWHTTGSRSVSRVRDLSVGGAFVASDAPPAIGTPINLLFALPEGEIRIKGLVRYRREKEGMGVEFTTMGSGARARLLEFLRRLTTNTVGAPEHTKNVPSRPEPDGKNS